MTVKVPPLKCQGIKTKLVEWIKDHAILENDGTWIEPFMGSGVVGFNVSPSRAIFSDVNPHIVSFYNAIKEGKITVGIAKEFLEKEGALLREKGEDHYYKVRERFNKNGSSLDMLFLNRACFNGVMRFNKKGGFNVPFGHKPERFAKAYITKITNQIKYVSDALSQYDWRFVCQDFRKTISSASQDDFIYCDPHQYVGTQGVCHPSMVTCASANLPVSPDSPRILERRVAASHLDHHDGSKSRPPGPSRREIY